MDIEINAFSYVCEGNILENSEEYSGGGSYHQYSRVTDSGIEEIEAVMQERDTLYWGRVEAGKEGRYVTEEEAMSVIASYKRIQLDMTPITEYPLN